MYNVCVCVWKEGDGGGGGGGVLMNILFRGSGPVIRYSLLLCCYGSRCFVILLLLVWTSFILTVSACSDGCSVGIELLLRWFM